MYVLPFDVLIFPLFVEKFIKKVLKDLLTVLFFNIFEARVHIHESSYLIELTKAIKVFLVVL